MLSVFLRTFLPRWNFFDQLGPGLVLDVKAVGATTWVSIPFEAERKKFSLLVNPEVTLLHALMNVVGDFISDLSNIEASQAQLSDADLNAFTSYRMLKSIVFSKIINLDGQSIQFRIVANSGSSAEIIFVSNVLVKPW